MGRLKRLLLAALAVLAAFGCACNGAPQNTCTPSANSVAAASTPPTSCDGICVSTAELLGDAGSTTEVCTVDCTDGGNAVCAAGSTCTSGEPFTSRSYCLYSCGGDAGDSGTCPSGLVCIPDAGVCL